MKIIVAEYDVEAATYDVNRFSNDFGLHLDYMHKRILNSFIKPPSKLVLDAGIGAGRFGIWLANRGFTVIGIDISVEMLKRTKEKTRHLNSDVEVIIGDVHYLPFRSSLFDTCVSINVIDHFSDSDEFFRQVRRVVKPKGSFVFNFSNLLSLYFPVAAVINLTGHGLFKRNILSKWMTYREVTSALSSAGLCIKSVRGCMIASPIPFGRSLLPFVRSINLVFEWSRFRFLSGSLFIEARPQW